MEIRNIMTQPAVTVSTEATLADVGRLMLRYRIGCVPVVDDLGELKGIITESEFLPKERGFPFSSFSEFRWPKLFGQWLPKKGIEQIYRAGRGLAVREFMHADVITVTEDTSVEEAVQIMLRHKIHHLPVVRDKVPIGIVARQDLLRMLV